MNYLDMESISKIHAKVVFGYIPDWPSSRKKLIFDKILSKLNIKEVEIGSFGEESLIRKICKTITNCDSLRVVKFSYTKNAEAQLDVAQTNPKIKQWKLRISSDEVTESFKEKLQASWSKFNDNSLYVYNIVNKLDDIGCMSQIFDIQPSSFY